MQVTKHVHALRLPFKIPVGPGINIDRFVYAFLVYGETICLIDTGVASSADTLLEYIRKTGRTPEDISLVVQTHSHPDHIGSTGKIKHITGCRVAAHNLARRWIEDVELQSMERPVPGFDILVGGPAGVDRLLEEGDVVDLGGGLTLGVIYTPGHSKDSISLFLNEDKVLISGDSVPVAGEFPIYDDFPAAVASVKRLMGMDGMQVLLSSWDEPREGPAAYKALVEGLDYLRLIHDEVVRATGGGAVEPTELCGRVVAALSLPPTAVNPLVARSLMSNVEVIRKGIETGF